MSLYFIYWLIVPILVEPASSAKILGVSPVVGGSHYIVIRNVMEELASRGHEVTLIVTSAQSVKESDKITHKVVQVPFKEGVGEVLSKILIEAGGPSWEFLSYVMNIKKVTCELMLNNTDFLSDLKGFDLMVHDSMELCSVMLAQYLGIQRVEVIPASPNGFFAWAHMIPMPVSYIPQVVPGYSDKMTFLQRVVNLGASVSTGWFQFVLSQTMNNIKIKYNIKPEQSLWEAQNEAELCIITADFALEYPQPLLPGNIMVGPLNAKDSQPLPNELEAFVNNSDHGFIVVSFGSNVGFLAKEKVDMMAIAFGKLKQKVVWRLKGHIPSSLSPNIKISEWLPQNDLLGHKDVRAFVSHVGHNSLYESAYHGVPLIAFPLFGDQAYNAKRVEYFGLGLSVDHKTFDDEHLFQRIENVIYDPRFKNAAIRVSKLLRDRQRTPLETTGDWVEYVLKHGGARHLRAQVFYLSWYQYYLLDVILFLVTIVIVVGMAIRLAFKCLCRLCCRQRGSKSKKE